MKIVTISGKSGSGKSYVANLIASIFDANLIDIDKISHKTLELKNIKTEIKKMFGESVFDGTKINRRKLSQIAGRLLYKSVWQFWRLVYCAFIFLYRWKKL